MTIISLVIALFVANIVAFGFHIELGLGTVFISFQFGGILLYFCPTPSNTEEIE